METFMGYFFLLASKDIILLSAKVNFEKEIDQEKM